MQQLVLFGFAVSAENAKGSVRMVHIETEGEIKMALKLTEIIHREGFRKYASVCPEFPVASQGKSERHASRMLAEAVELCLESGDKPTGELYEETIQDMDDTLVECPHIRRVYHGPLRHSVEQKLASI